MKKTLVVAIVCVLMGAAMGTAGTLIWKHYSREHYSQTTYHLRVCRETTWYVGDVHELMNAGKDAPLGRDVSTGKLKDLVVGDRVEILGFNRVANYNLRVRAQDGKEYWVCGAMDVDPNPEK